MRPQTVPRCRSIRCATSSSAGTVAEAALGAAGSPRRRISSSTWSSHRGSIRPGYASCRARSMFSFRERSCSMYGALPPPSLFARYPSINTSMVSRGSRPAASSSASPGSANVRASAMSRDALNPGGSRPARRARWTSTSSSTLEGVGNVAPRSRTGGVLLAVVVTGGGCTDLPAWCGPESKGTETGACTGSTGCSQNEEVPPSAGVTVFPVAAGCAAVVPEAVAGRSSHPRQRPRASAPAASEREGPGRLDAAQGPGTTVACTSPPAGSV